MKKCPVCEKDFEPKSGKQIFCSDACKMKAARAKKKNKDPFPDSTLLDMSLAALSGEPSRFDGVFKKIAKENGLADKSWQQSIEEYCGIVGITPEELIAQHKIFSHKKATGQTATKIEHTVVHAKEYNPNDNWRFKSKLGKNNNDQP